MTVYACIGLFEDGLEDNPLLSSRPYSVSYTVPVTIGTGTNSKGYRYLVELAQ